MRKFQEGGGNQEAAVQQILQFVQQALQQGAQPNEVAQALLSQQIPPQIVVQIFVQMGMDQGQATAAVQGAAQGAGPSQGQSPMQGQGMPAQGSQEEQMEGAQGQEAPPQEMMEGQAPMGMYGGGYAKGGSWNGTYSGNQGFANGGINPYIYNDPYSYMEMGGAIPRAQYGMTGIPERPLQEEYPDYASFKSADDEWVSMYGDQDPYAINQPLDEVGYANPNLQMIPSNIPVSVAASSPASNYSGATVQDWLTSRGLPSSYAARQAIAATMNIPNYRGSASENNLLLNKLTMAEQSGALGSTPTTAAIAPTSYSNNKSKITSNTNTQKALTAVANRAQAIASNPTKYNVAPKAAPIDSIPTVSLDSVPTMDTTKAPTIDTSYMDVSDSSDMPKDTLFQDLPAKQLDSVLNSGAQLTAKEKKAIADDNYNKIWKTVGLIGASTGLGLAWKSYKANIKSAEQVKDLIEKNRDAENIKEGELLAEIDKKYKTPENIMERAKARGFYTTDEKAVLDGVTDKKLKAEIKKLTFNPNANSNAVLTNDMIAEGWGPGNEFNSPENQQKIAAHLDDNMKQAEEIIAVAEKRGYRTAEDIKKLRKLLDNESITRLTANLGKGQSQNMAQRVGSAIGSTADNLGEGIKTKYQNLTERAGKLATNLKASAKNKFTPKYDFVPGDGLEGTRAWSTISNLGNVADINAGGIEVEEAQYILSNPTKYSQKKVNEAQKILSNSKITPEFQNIVSAYTQQMGEIPASNTELVDQYHADLQSGVRSPLVEAIESGTGISSIKQRTGTLGNTFEGLKKSKAAVTNRVGNMATTVRNAPGKVKNAVATRFQKPTVPINAVPGEVASNEISQPIELSVEPAGTVTPKRSLAQSIIDRANLRAKTTPTHELRNSFEPTETPSVVEGLKSLFGKAIKYGRKVKEEYGGPIMEEGGYVPNYAMAYGGDYIPEAAMGMGFGPGNGRRQYNQQMPSSTNVYNNTSSTSNNTGQYFTDNGMQINHYPNNVNDTSYNYSKQIPGGGYESYHSGTGHYDGHPYNQLESNGQFQTLPPDQSAQYNRNIFNSFQKAYGGANYKKGGIHINPANKGKFTKSASSAGMSTQQFANHVLSNKDRYSPTQVKRANFAKNAAKWKHEQGGLVEGQEMNVTPEQLQMLKDGGYQFQIMH